jgi:Zn-dependent protease
LAIARAAIFVGMFFLVSGPVHECSHAFAAWKLGDGTAKLFGRVTLDPIRHFDPIGGTLLAGSVLLGLISGGATIGFGWAKPTPVNPFNLRGRYSDSIVSAAGPLSNLALAAVCAIGFRILWAGGGYPDNTSAINMLTLVFFIGMELNVLLMLFNLIPIPPLDGSKILMSFLPEDAQANLSRLEPYGFLILILLLFTGLLNPVIGFMQDLIYSFITLVLKV